jgi:hypothetical protein
MNMRWTSGYHGEDSLRNKAEKWAKQELMGAEGGDVPSSMSARQNTKMRPFKKGGHCSGGKMAEGGRIFPAGYFTNRKSMQQNAAQMADGGIMLQPGFSSNMRSGMPMPAMLKKGGRAHHGRHHGLTHEQTDLYIPTKSRNKASRHMSIEKADRLARGGNMRLSVQNPKEYAREGMRHGGSSVQHEQHQYEKKHGKNKKGFGGLLGGLGGSFFGGPMGGMLGSTLGNLLPFKEGGHAGKRHHKHRAMGGMLPSDGMRDDAPIGAHSYPARMLGRMQAMKEAGSLRRNPALSSMAGMSPNGGSQDDRAMSFKQRMGRQPRFNVPMNAAGMAEGGNAKRHGGHMRRRASGGTVYEHHMVGEMPGKKAHHFSYESEMRGERAVSRPSSRHQSKRGLHDMEHGQLFREGGTATAKRGGHKKAAGGVGKIRHEQATSSGQPRGARRVIRNNLF